MVAGLHNQLSFSFKDFLNPATIRICFSRIFAEEARVPENVPSDNSLRVWSIE
jgi:hypothetical protein